MLDEWSSTLTRRLEQVLHVHPEKYRARSNRTSRNNTPVSHVSQRSHSIDYINEEVEKGGFQLELYEIRVATCD
ncbi:hypothetical protein L596_002074 [Steinernema carpocapsae]|uniref:Uncharacterized protein n=1 Tax=Steinernema carpocapsae TaxID=34508 RepID=A0A4U8UNE1_STECR|nr:hypothetical protein L596_002074 [Steinernema carpocapsae]